MGMSRLGCGTVIFPGRSAWRKCQCDPVVPACSQPCALRSRITSVLRMLGIGPPFYEHNMRIHGQSLKKNAHSIHILAGHGGGLQPLNVTRASPGDRRIAKPAGSCTVSGGMDDTTPSIERLLAIMARLRDRERGCPWDVEQTFGTIAPYTIEEAYEVAEAIERNDLESLKDELGDLLFQVVFHARMAEEAGAFDFDEVARAASDKMVRRHPHVFADKTIDTAAAQTRHWEDLKATERAEKAAADGGAASVLDGLALGLPALLRALKLQRRAARVGFDWPDPAQVFDKIAEEIAELQQEIATDGKPERL